MTYRATKTELNEVFKLFCEAIGKRVAQNMERHRSLDPRLRQRIRRLRHPGNYQRQRGQRNATGPERLSATELVERMRFALRWLEQKDRNKD